MKDVFKIQVNDQNLVPGRILVASPELDGFFKRSVILITEHDYEGSMGFVLNKPTHTRISEVINNLYIPDSSLYLMLGGPVDFSSLHFIHVFGQQIPDAQKLSSSLYLGGDFKAIVGLLNNESILANQIKFLVGYAGWAAGQLLDELNHQTWAISDLDESLVFSTPNLLWEKAVEQLGPRYSLWLNYPELPEMN